MIRTSMNNKYTPGAQKNVGGGGGGFNDRFFLPAVV